MPFIKNSGDTAHTIEVYKKMRQSYIEDGYRGYSFVKTGVSNDNLSAVTRHSTGGNIRGVIPCRKRRSATFHFQTAGGFHNSSVRFHAHI